MQRTSLLLALAVMVIWPGSSRAAQEQAEQAVELYLGFDTTMPGAKAYLTLTFTANGAKVGKVTSEVSFPKKLLTFVEAKRSQAGDDAEADLSAEVKEDGKDPELSILTVQVSAKKEIPNGPLVNLQFSVAPSAKEGVIKLKNAVKATTLKGDEVKGAKGNAGELTVNAQPVAPLQVCFFFSH